MHRSKFNIPFQHMSSAPCNYCHTEQFGHMIGTKHALREQHMHIELCSRRLVWMKLMSVQMYGCVLEREHVVDDFP